MPGKFEAPRGGARRNPQPGSRQSQPRRSGNQPPRSGGSYHSRRKKSPIVPILLILLVVTLLLTAGFAAWKLLGSRSGNTPADPTQPAGTSPST